MTGEVLQPFLARMDETDEMDETDDMGEAELVDEATLAERALAIIPGGASTGSSRDRSPGGSTRRRFARLIAPCRAAGPAGVLTAPPRGPMLPIRIWPRTGARER